MSRIVSYLGRLIKQSDPRAKEAECIQLPLRLISGKHRISGKEMAFLYSGHNPFNLNMWGDNLLKEWKEELLEPVLMKELTLKILNKKYPKCSFLLVEKILLAGHQKIRIPSIDIPNWIQTWIDTSKPVNELCKISKPGFKNARRLIRKYGMTCHEVNKPEDRRHIYENMYLPYLRNNTGRYVRELPFEDIFSSSRPDRLYHIKMEGKPVGGAVATFGDNKASFGFLGITNGDAGYVKTGVINAMYYFLAEDFHKRNIDKMFLGGSPPFLSHPLTRYKIRMRARHNSNHKYGDHEVTSCFILDQEKAMNELFSLTPFVFLNNGEACSLLYPANKTFTVQAEIEKLLELPGRLGITNNICLEPSGKKLSTEWQKLLTNHAYKNIKFDRFIKHFKGSLK
jgi:hypothetical protein